MVSGDIVCRSIQNVRVMLKLTSVAIGSNRLSGDEVGPSINFDLGGVVGLSSWCIGQCWTMIYLSVSRPTARRYHWIVCELGFISCSSYSSCS